MNNYISIHCLFLGILLVSGCQQPKPTPSEEQVQSSSIQSVALSQAQLTMAGIEVGIPEKRVMTGGVQCTGIIEVPPQYLVSVCAPTGGFIRSLNFIQGEAVQKGDVVAVLEHQQIIQLQQDYLESKGKLTYLEAEYNRKKQLDEKDATARRAFEAAQADYEVAQAQFQGFQAQLALVGIELSRLDTQGIQQRLVIRSPIKGYVVAVPVNLGQYIDPAREIVRIVDKSHIHLELSVFVQDLPLIEVGQPFIFRLPGDTDTYTGAILLKSQQVEGPDKTLKIHGHIADKQNQELIPGTFVQAEIQTESDTVFAIPLTALVREGGSTYVFVQRDSTFSRREVVLGKKDETWVEVKSIENAELTSEIVLEGAYYLQGSF